MNPERMFSKEVFVIVYQHSGKAKLLLSRFFHLACSHPMVLVSVLVHRGSAGASPSHDEDTICETGKRTT
ncbi:hypothetical protein CA54_55750 [Symmachiella macrocystis]|uniref:Uncharacterized protein n=1 Tax=Symmachiella macrocystis TaxID=2527985 RepID=A0A5C6B5F2_9PLAN|nr:hypothetical protein CA54_55750 [Symmachiella macrocystis]